MAIAIDISKFSSELSEQIYTDLEIIPIPPPAPPQFRGRKFTPAPAAQPPFVFCLPQSKTIFHVPLLYAVNTLPQIEETPRYKRIKNLSATLQRSQVTLLPAQLPIVEEAITHLTEQRTTTLDLHTGRGKTIISAHLATQLQLKTAVIVPIKPLVKQWIETFKLFGFSDDQICEVPEPSKLKTRKKPPNFGSVSIFIILKTRVASLPPEVRQTIGTVVFDEAHLMCTPSWIPVLLGLTPFYLIVLTATMERDDGTNKMMSLMAGDHAVTRKSERPYHVIAYTVKIRVPETTNEKTGRMDYSRFLAELSESEEYNLAICNTVLANPNRKFIILFRLIEHAMLIATILQEAGVSCDVLMGTKKSYRDSRVLCGTFGKISTGFDAKMFSEQFDGVNPDALIFANTTKKWQLFAQSIGRVMRAGEDVIPLVIWMVTLNSVTKKHLTASKKFIKESKGTVREVNEVPILKEAKIGEGVEISTSEKFKEAQENLFVPFEMVSRK